MAGEPYDLAHPVPFESTVDPADDPPYGDGETFGAEVTHSEPPPVALAKVQALLVETLEQRRVLQKEQADLQATLARVEGIAAHLTDMSGQMEKLLPLVEEIIKQKKAEKGGLFEAVPAGLSPSPPRHTGGEPSQEEKNDVWNRGMERKPIGAE